MKIRRQIVSELTIEGVQILVVRKAIKHVNLRVSPPDGRVRVAIPWAAPADSVRRIVVRKLDWIRGHQARLAAQPRPTRPRFVSGELHEYFGDRYELSVIEGARRAAEVDHDRRMIRLYVPSGSDTAGRERALLTMYRRELAPLVPPLIEAWQATIGVRVAEWRLKQMKTRWGTCNIKARRVWLNLELAKRPPRHLEFIVVHELVHLLERNHNARFRSFMDRFLPDWRTSHQELRQRATGCILEG